MLIQVLSDSFTRSQQLMINCALDIPPNAKQNLLFEAFWLCDECWWFTEIYPWLLALWIALVKKYSFLIALLAIFCKKDFLWCLLKREKTRNHSFIFVGFMRNPFSSFWIFPISCRRLEMVCCVTSNCSTSSFCICAKFSAVVPKLLLSGYFWKALFVDQTEK